MKIAIPFFGTRVSSRLDCCENFLIVTVRNGEIKSQQKIRLVKNRPAILVNFLTELQVDVLICGGITDYYAKHLSNTLIQVVPWTVGEIDEVLHQYLAGKFANQLRSGD